MAYWSNERISMCHWSESCVLSCTNLRFSWLGSAPVTLWCNATNTLAMGAVAYCRRWKGKWSRLLLEFKSSIVRFVLIARECSNNNKNILFYFIEVRCKYVASTHITFLSLHITIRIRNINKTLWWYTCFTDFLAQHQVAMHIGTRTTLSILALFRCLCGTLFPMIYVWISNAYWSWALIVLHSVYLQVALIQPQIPSPHMIQYRHDSVSQTHGWKTVDSYLMVF